MVAKRKPEIGGNALPKQFHVCKRQPARQHGEECQNCCQPTNDAPASCKQVTIGEKEWQKYKQQDPIERPDGTSQPIEYSSCWQRQVPLYPTVCCINPTKIGNRGPNANRTKDPTNSVPCTLADNQSAHNSKKSESEDRTNCGNEHQRG